MNELNMSIYTGKNEENKVTLTAAFDTHDEAVAFHNGLAMLCNQHSRSRGSAPVRSMLGRLLTSAPPALEGSGNYRPK